MIKDKNWNNEEMKLVHADSGKLVQVGDFINDMTILGGSAPHKPSSTGRILVQKGKFKREFFPSVANLEWVVCAS